MKLQFHENCRHDCSDFPDEEKYEKFKATKPYAFRSGDIEEVPDDAGDYFIRAGWASEEGGTPVKPDPTKAVFVHAHSSKLGVKNNRKAN